MTTNNTMGGRDRVRVGGRDKGRVICDAAIFTADRRSNNGQAVCVRSCIPNSQSLLLYYHHLKRFRHYKVRLGSRDIMCRVVCDALCPLLIEGVERRTNMFCARALACLEKRFTMTAVTTTFDDEDFFHVVDVLRMEVVFLIMKCLAKAQNIRHIVFHIETVKYERYRILYSHWPPCFGDELLAIPQR